MELQVTGKNVEISQEVHLYLEKKLGKLARHLPDITESKVEIAREKAKEPQNRYVVQVTLNSRGTLLRGEVRGKVLATAIDEVANILDRQIERYKGRLYSRSRKGAATARTEAPPIPEEKLGRVVKEKRFIVKPMAVEEAIEQMELLGHDFFLFLPPDSGQFNVIYRRQDGDYGLISPETG